MVPAIDFPTKFAIFISLYTGAPYKTQVTIASNKKNNIDIDGGGANRKLVAIVSWFNSATKQTRLGKQEIRQEGCQTSYARWII